LGERRGGYLVARLEMDLAGRLVDQIGGEVPANELLVVDQDRREFHGVRP